MAWQSQPYAPPNNSPPGTTYTYDALGRTINVLLADGASHTQYIYQGNTTTVVDPAGKWKQYFTDALGNLVTVLEPDPQYNPPAPNPPPAYPVTSAPQHMLLTSYTYDQLNHLTQVSMPRSTGTQTRTFAYIPTTYPNVTLPALRLTSATNPENGTVSYTYNADGTLASKLDAKGNTESYTYDSYGRLTGVPDRQQTFTWDTCPPSDTFCTSTPGQIVEAIFASNVGPNQLSIQYDYTYTPAGKVASKMLTLQSANHKSMSQVPASGSLTASYTYDDQGALTSMVSPIYQTWVSTATQTFNYTLDAMERPTGLADSWSDQRPPTTYASGVTYTAAGQTNFGGRAYNNLLQLTQVGNMTYSYAPNANNGQITSSVDSSNNETVNYTYDALKRLATASSNLNWGETYGYDGFGNLTQMTPSGTAGAPNLSVSVDATTNRITPTGVYYDNNGNVTSILAGTNLYYDAANRVTRVQISGNSWYYGYDTGNLRVYYRNASGAETIYFYGADGHKLATYTYTIITYNGNPEIQLTQQSENVYFTGIMVRAENQTVTVDRLGSVTSYLGTHRYYPYGVEYTSTANDREKYATYTRDSLTGLDYAVNRYYSSIWGRFLSPDLYGDSAKLANPGTWNKYAYVRGDPISLSDPAGLEPEESGCWVNNILWFSPCPSLFINGGRTSQWQQAMFKIAYFQVYAVGVLLSGPSDNCEKDINALGAASQSTPGAQPIDDLSLAAAIGAMNVQDGVTATAPASSLNDPSINAVPNVANGPISNYFKNITGVEAMAQLGGNSVYFRPAYALNLSMNAGSALVTHEALHNLGLNDDQVEAALGLTDKQCGTGTDCISIKLEQDCFRHLSTLLGAQ